jgi:hypothetical protein
MYQYEHTEPTSGSQACSAQSARRDGRRRGGGGTVVEDGLRYLQYVQYPADGGWEESRLRAGR